MDEKNKKKIKIASLLVMLLLVVIGGTYAYFVAQLGDAASKNVNVLTDTTDSLIFNINKEISINANQENFAEGKGNRSDTAIATAKLIAGTNRTATYNYFLLLNIATNDFSYTTTEKKPELILKVTDPESKPVTTISGLTYNSELEGFDITTQKGLITIADNYEISTNGTKIDNWNVEVVFVNLDSDQNDNTNKTFNAQLQLTKINMKEYVMPVLNIVTTNYYSGTLNFTFSANNGATGSTAEKYYYALEKAEPGETLYSVKNGTAASKTPNYQSSTTSNVTVSGLESDTLYHLYAYVEDKNGYTSNVYEDMYLTSEGGEYNGMYYPTVTYSANAINVSNDSLYFSKNYISIDGGEFIEMPNNKYAIENYDVDKTYNISLYGTVEGNAIPCTPIYEIKAKYPKAKVTEMKVYGKSGNALSLGLDVKYSGASFQKLLYSVNGGEYIEASSNPFSIDGLEPNTEYTISAYIIDTNNVRSNEVQLKAITDDKSLTNVCNSGDNLSNCIKKLRTNDGDNNLYYHDESGDYLNFDQESNDKSYRFVGPSPLNYVCFGSDAENCPSTNLYRIMGLYDYNNDGNYQIKLIRNSFYGSPVYWSGAKNDTTSIWKHSTMNTYTLNNDFYNTFTNDWKNMIETSTWYTLTSGFAYNDYRAAKEVYAKELESTDDYVTQAKIGLMNPSDYMYGAPSDYWTKNGYNYSGAKNYNWMFVGSEWTIGFSNVIYAASISTSGSVGNSPVGSTTNNIRPVFNITHDTIYKSGIGTQSDPIRIQLPTN